jgi:aminomethyltransferase
MSNLKHTPLFDEHSKLGARMVPFGEWEMPVQYSSVIKEHHTVRETAGLFDVCHMGEIFVSGGQAKAFLNQVTTNDVSKLYDGRCQYSLFCNEEGFVIDDLIINQIHEDRFLLIVNASNIDKDFKWLKKHQWDDVTIENKSDEWSMLALQGPKSTEILNTVLGKDISLKYFHCSCEIYNESHFFVARTGYTGELGYEIMLPNHLVVEFWQKILEQGKDSGVVPVGLAARDTLRLEAGYSLYGHELSDSINPLEANLNWVVSFNKSDFIGKASLLKVKENKPQRTLIGLKLIDKGIARDGCKIFSNDKEVGYVTSGTFSPSLNQAIAIALVESQVKQDNSEIYVEIRDKMKKAAICKLPFLKKN